MSILKYKVASYICPITIKLSELQTFRTAIKKVKQKLLKEKYLNMK